MALPDPPAADYVRKPIEFAHIRTYTVTRRVIDAFMEPAQGLPDALPNAKKLRAGIQALLTRNVNLLVRRADPEASNIVGSQYTYRFENEEDGDGAEENRLALWNNRYAFVIVEEDPDRPRGHFISINKREGVQNVPIDAVSEAFIRAVEATTRGVDAEAQRVQRNTERRGVGEISVSKGLPPLMLGKEVGKFLGGKRRKTKAKKSKKSRRRTRRSI